MINVYIVSGFLGAGKTTFIQKLLSEKKFNKVMLLENEFGEVGVDAAFFDKSLNVKEINNGCICCSLQGDFKTALEEIEDMGVSDLIIEPSGVGKLSEIIDVVKGDSDFRIVSHICIVDVKTAKKYHINFKEYFDDQVKAANALVLSHVDVSEKENINNVIDILKELNAEAIILDRDLKDYSIDELLNLIVMNGEIVSFEHNENCQCHCCCHDEGEHHHHHHDHEHDCEHHHHHHDDEDEPFDSIVYRPKMKYSKNDLENILSKMEDNVIRVKGYVFGENGTLYFNYVLNEYHIFEGENRDDSLVVIIGTDLNIDKFREFFNE